MNVEIVPGLMSIVIVNYNRCDDLYMALQSVQAQDYSPIEIIVVDNASTDDSCEMITTKFPQVRLVKLSENTGMDGYSIGFQKACGEFIFQMDNDSILQDTDILSAIVRRFREGPVLLGAVATRVEQYAGNADLIPELKRRDQRQGPINTGGFPGAVAFRSEFLHQVGYYNRDVFLYGSELFLQMKFLAAGYQIFFYPEIMTLHKASIIERAMPSKSLYYQLRNRYWYIRRFGTLSQQCRFVPFMLLHDVIYSTYKRLLRVFFEALHDGFGTMPVSLLPPLRSSRPEFVAKVEEFGATFGIRQLIQRIVRRTFSGS